MHIEGSRSGRTWVAGDMDNVNSQSLEKYKEEIKSLQMEIESLKARHLVLDPVDSVNSQKEFVPNEEKVVEIHEDKTAILNPVDMASGTADSEDAQSIARKTFDLNAEKSEEVSQELFRSSSNGDLTSDADNDTKENSGQSLVGDSGLPLISDNLSSDHVSENMASLS